jgi:hypothetical protein
MFNKLSLLLASSLIANAVMAAEPPALITTFSDGNLAVLLTQPDVGLPAPTQVVATGLVGTARPHGLTWINADEALAADFSVPTLYRVKLGSASALGSYVLSGRSTARGTLAVSPNNNFVLSIGESIAGAAEAVVLSGFASGAVQINPIVPALRVRGFVTSAVDFEANGRAYVCHVDGVAALDPPYTSIAFNVPLTTQTSTSVCRLSRDGQRLFVTRAGPGIGVATAPLSASSVPITILAPTGVGALGPIGVSPDGNALLIGQSFRIGSGAKARLFLLRAPYTAASTMQELTLPAAITATSCIPNATTDSECPGFEDIDISPDGKLAIVTGNSTLLDSGFTGRAPALFIRNPFDDATREMHAVMVASPALGNHGRGTGGARFQPADLRIFANGYE